MLAIIKNILDGDQYPLLKNNQQAGHVFRQFSQDTPNIFPQYTPIYKIKFQHIEHHPYKVHYYFRIINNDIYTTLNQCFAQYAGKSAPQIQFHHQNFKRSIEEYMYKFYEKIQQQAVPSNLLKEPPSTFDELQMFVIIAYYAIASLACAYFQYLDQFSMSLPTKDRPENPYDFIYATLQASFPKEILIIDTTAPNIEEQPKGNIYNVQGDLIQGEKHVGTQVDYVASGGIGAQIKK